MTSVSEDGLKDMWATRYSTVWPPTPGHYTLAEAYLWQHQWTLLMHSAGVCARHSFVNLDIADPRGTCW